MGSHSDDFEARLRFIHLDGGQRRDAMSDCRTAVPSLLPLPRRSPFEALFVAHYRAIRALGRDADLGVALIVVHVPSCALRARAWFAARPDGLTTAIVGRHSEADVMLEAPTISLRHLALLVAPGPAGVRYELLDLRTQHPFVDERGHALESVQAEGPGLFSCGPYALYLLPTGDPAAWPELATEAWARLPERVLLEEQEAEPPSGRRPGPPRREVVASRTESMIRSVAPLLTSADSLLAPGERPLGTLWVQSVHGLARLRIGAQAATRGVLLGRYDRCDASVVLASHGISRTHLLVKRVDGQLVGVDTASSNGVYVDGAAQRTVALERGEVAVLADDRALVSWHPA